MRARLNVRVLTIAAAMIGVLLIPATAFAYAPTGDDFITCVAGGDNNIECVAGVFEADCTGQFETSTGASGAVTADSSGEVAFDFDVPADQPAGDIDVTVQCGTKVLSETIANVTEDGDVIANTGFDASLLAIGALAALGLGGAALFVARRSRTTA